MDNSETPQYVDLDARLATLSEPKNNCLYYAITLTADEGGQITFGTQTEWVGWANEERHEELRGARLVYPEFVNHWKRVEQPYAIIHSADEASLFLMAGGNALVEQELAMGLFPRLLKPKRVLADGQAGFVSPGLLPETAFRRAPTPKLRMQIFKRDQRRCRICGRRPDDNVDLVLHVHHIRPWEKGGITDPKNLITLCHTCHSGLDPHDDRSLFGYIRPQQNDSGDSKSIEFRAAVVRYRKVGFASSLKETSKRTKRRKVAEL